MKGLYCTRVWTSVDISCCGVFAVMVLAAAIDMTVVVIRTEKTKNTLIATNALLWADFALFISEILAKTYTLVNSRKYREKRSLHKCIKIEANHHI